MAMVLGSGGKGWEWGIMMSTLLVVGDGEVEEIGSGDPTLVVCLTCSVSVDCLHKLCSFHIDQDSPMFDSFVTPTMQMLKCFYKCHLNAIIHSYSFLQPTSIQIRKTCLDHIGVVFQQCHNSLLKRLDHNLRYLRRNAPTQRRIEWIRKRKLQRQRHARLILTQFLDRPFTPQMLQQPIVSTTSRPTSPRSEMMRNVLSR